MASTWHQSQPETPGPKFLTYTQALQRKSTALQYTSHESSIVSMDDFCTTTFVFFFALLYIPMFLNDVANNAHCCIPPRSVVNWLLRPGDLQPLRYYSKRGQPHLKLRLFGLSLVCHSPDLRNFSTPLPVDICNYYACIKFRMYIIAQRSMQTRVFLPTPHVNIGFFSLRLLPLPIFPCILVLTSRQPTSLLQSYHRYCPSKNGTITVHASTCILIHTASGPAFDIKDLRILCRF